MSDLIDRQAAIDAITQLAIPLTQSEFPQEHYVLMGISDSLREIKELPSAQPERSLWFRIGEICVDESKGFISADRAVEKIRELLRKAERGWEE